MGVERKELDKEEARDDCKKYGAPTPGVDHSNHWKKIPYETLPEKENNDEKS